MLTVAWGMLVVGVDDKEQFPLVPDVSQDRTRADLRPLRNRP